MSDGGRTPSKAKEEYPWQTTQDKHLMSTRSMARTRPSRTQSGAWHDVPHRGRWPVASHAKVELAGLVLTASHVVVWKTDSAGWMKFTPAAFVGMAPSVTGGGTGHLLEAEGPPDER